MLQELRKILASAVCGCRKHMALCQKSTLGPNGELGIKYRPLDGYMPRGFYGAKTARKEDVRLVLIMAEPGEPVPLLERYDGVDADALIGQHCAMFEKVYKGDIRGNWPFHRAEARSSS